MAMIAVPQPLREKIRAVQDKLTAERGRPVTVAEALEYLIEQERKSVAP